MAKASMSQYRKGPSYCGKQVHTNHPGRSRFGPPVAQEESVMTLQQQGHRGANEIKNEQATALNAPTYTAVRVLY